MKAEKYDLTPCLNQFCGTNQSIIFSFVSVNQSAHFLFPHSFYYELELTFKNVVPIHSTFSNKLFQLAGGNKTSFQRFVKKALGDSVRDEAQFKVQSRRNIIKFVDFGYFWKLSGHGGTSLNFRYLRLVLGIHYTMQQ